MLRLPSANGTPRANGPLSLIRNGTPASGPSGSWSSAGSNNGRANALRSASARWSARRATASCRSGGERVRVAGLVAPGRSERLGDQLARPAHPSYRRLRVVAELLRDPLGTALAAQVTDRPHARLPHLRWRGGLRALERRGEQRFAPYRGDVKMGHGGLRSAVSCVRASIRRVFGWRSRVIRGTN